ncbi:MAG TPA: hypothetical protein VK595_17305 [Vicinamibacterales bacterium]|jgi:hypothetical protein|nr:hypothetical protein [Vicinamibacterales bacterium]
MSSEPATATVATVTASDVKSLSERRRTADRIFRGALAFNTALTLFWAFMIVTQRDAFIFHQYSFDRTTIASLFFSLLFFYVIWGYIWYAVKNALLKSFVGFSKEERRQAFSSRMDAPFDVAAIVSRYSERRIRIADMIGRRGRFITLAMAGFYFLYRRVATEPTDQFATLFLQDNLFDAVITSWVFLGFFYVNGSVAAAFYGAQSRIMDGVLARANNLLITTLWTAFKFVMVPLGAKLSTVFPASQFAIVFALIWGSYIACDALAEIGGSLFGKQTLRVWGIGDVNRKSIGGTVSGFAGSLVFCLWVVLANGLPAPWIGLAVVIAISNTVLELSSPRGTDDLFMATGNALICLAFGMLIL